MPVALQIFFSAMACFPFALFRTWDVAMTAQLNARLRALRAAGDPVTMAELGKTYPEPPKGQNAAELLNRAFAAMTDLGEDDALFLLVPIVGTAEMPGVDEELPPPMLRAIRDHLKDNAEALKLLHEAGAREGCKFDLDFTKGPGMLLPHLAKMRGGARLLALEAIERAESGKPGEAADAIVAALRLGRALQNEPMLISGLVRIASDGIAIGHAQRWASRARPSPEALRRVEAALLGEADTKYLAKVMASERCFGIDIYQSYVLEGRGAAELGEAFGGAMPHLLRPVLKPYVKADMIAYVDIMNEFVSAARKPYPECYIRGAQVGKSLEKRIPGLFPVARMILPALGRIFIEGQRHMARVESARTALAALRYRARHARLPARLQDLVPGFIEAVPPDPFTGKPLRYRKTREGFVVYAVGEDGRDDGGQTERREGKPPDVGFRVRWPKAHF